MSGTIVVDRIESDASYASSINIASPIQISNTITGNVNFDSGTLFVDSVGDRVGIGTSSPGQKLDVNGALISTGAISSHLTNSSSMSYDGSGEFSLRAYGATSGTGYMTFSTGGGGNSAGGVRMTIDAAGRVTTPNQPAFYAYRNAGAITATGAFVFNVAPVNVGGHYNTSTGIFTAPVTGIYALNFFVLAQDSDNWDINVFKNGSVYGSYDIRANGDPINGNFTTGLSGLIALSTNDTANIQVVFLLSGDIYADGLNGFSMWLVG